MFIRPSAKEHPKHTFHIGASIVLANHMFVFLTLQSEDKINRDEMPQRMSSQINIGVIKPCCYSDLLAFCSRRGEKTMEQPSFLRVTGQGGLGLFMRAATSPGKGRGHFRCQGGHSTQSDRQQRRLCKQKERGK